MTFMAEMSIKKRPKNLDLTTIRLPLPGKVSILHRVSGAGLFLCIPVLLWLFGASLGSPESFATFKSVAGMLLLDLHIGIEKEAARKSAGVVLAVSIPLTLIVWGVLL
jgi:succinate dehydrogenase / fumarate reductase cytochrome b subunit